MLKRIDPNNVKVSSIDLQKFKFDERVSDIQSNYKNEFMPS